MNLIHNSGTTAAAPIALSDERFSMLCAVLEAMASEHRSVLPAFFELTLKTKYTRDDISSQIIDLVYDCSRKDLISEYSLVSGYYYGLISKCIHQGTGYASTYASGITAAQSNLTALYDEICSQN